MYPHGMHNISHIWDLEKTIIFKLNFKMLYGINVFLLWVFVDQIYRPIREHSTRLDYYCSFNIVSICIHFQYGLVQPWHLWDTNLAQ